MQSKCKAFSYSRHSGIMQACLNINSGRKFILILRLFIYCHQYFWSLQVESSIRCARQLKDLGKGFRYVSARFLFWSGN
jgi:hypothetical protein